MLIYQYPPLIPGILIRRYQRFFAEIELASGEKIIAHCPNTGRMTGVCQPGSLVQVSPQNNPRRKLPYTWEMIQVKSEIWVGVNTNLPNLVIRLALEKRIFTQLNPHYRAIRSEVPYGKKSRIDFLLTKEEKDPPVYLEVKNTTLAQANRALFPDTVTTRGQKHLQELMTLLPQAIAVMLYFINRSDCTEFAPGDEWDPTYGKLLRSAQGQGLLILPCRFEVNPEGIHYLGTANLCLE
ncbi:DNA/RNA nuclease SfsA [Gloeocapsa sp. PCC 73106]|uniref:DNA/RNA nuclease SfsA n=1 Tax=Gloeocapsa sp. PCC 73106 TaxID=102232 RepID=UPI0002ACDA7F|nr:DNA/RNA nuclease SfsA [Gloeocapsa sp. PCC 73106]ELR97192.1 sugar fermentation stimulation protein [Gloeocapsa sp. PCC 73106]